MPDPVLPRDAAPADDAGIVLWGPPGSGKSTYLATLVYYNESLDEQARRWCVLPADGVTAEWVVDRVQRWRDGAASPKSLHAEPQALGFRVYSLPPQRAGLFARRPAAAHVEATLRFWDVPGEAYASEIPDAIVRQMVGARGLLLVLDPGFDPPEGRERYYERFFLRTLGRLTFAMQQERARRGLGGAGLAGDNRLEIPVAICLSHLDEHPALREGDRVRLLRELFGDSTQLLEKWLTRWEVLPMSATGGPAGARAGADPSPELATHPIAWLLDQSRAAR
ncbi:hypothetical protein [Roseisolibacter sp. H3M3-2]|uniref:hypothetical protein n=1 Tax=Roseisolibacter sp. H3M3-2 TaxID=3031323 RepID=UPI0023DC0AC7|nr:hypothetical protein [Roseisolibacter sp. H3M3-2]MDF1505835.1 hypothetical protein [Roseisolibacter sp. H3M3-2]